MINNVVKERALVVGLKITIIFKVSNLVIERDSQNIISTFKKFETLKNILITSFKKPQTTYYVMLNIKSSIFREVNRVTNDLSNKGFLLEIYE